MATLYVSNSTANGYANGNDSRNRATIQSKSTPSLTLTHAWAVAQAGDVVVLNDGTFSEAAFLSGGTPITLSGETDYGARIRNATGSDSMVIYVPASGTGTVIGKVIIDANSAQSACLMAESVTSIAALTVSGTHMIGSTGPCMQSLGHVGTLTINQGATFTPNANASSAIEIVPVGTGLSISIDTISITCTGTTAVGIFINPAAGSTITLLSITNCPALSVVNVGGVAATYGIRYAPQATGPTCASVVCTGNAITVSCNHVSSAAVPVSWEAVTGTIVSSSNTLTVNGVVSTQAPMGIYIPSSASGNPTSVTVQNNTITVGSSSVTPTAGYGIRVGADSTTLPAEGRDLIHNILISGNTIKYANHGILVGWQSNHVVWGNTCDHVVLGLVDKQCGVAGGGLWTGNLLTRISSTDAAMLFKASGAGVMANNLHIITSGFTGRTEMASVASFGVAFRNNISYCDSGATPTVLVEALDTAQATFSTNDYWSDGGAIPATAFVWQGVAMSYAAWKAAHETTALNVTPAFAAYSGGDYHISAAGSLYRAGTGLGVSAKDFAGNTFAPISPSIGIYENVVTQTATVTEVVQDAHGSAIVGARVQIALSPVQPGYTTTPVTLLGVIELVTDAAGTWTATLARTDLMRPLGMSYTRLITAAGIGVAGQRRDTFTVPGAGPYVFAAVVQ